MERGVLMQEYLQKTQFGAWMDEIGVYLLLLAASLGGFTLLWGLRPMALLAGLAAFTLMVLLRTHTREKRLLRREERLRGRIGGEICLEEWTVCPSVRAHYETALLLRGVLQLSLLRVYEQGALCLRADTGQRVLIACAQLHREEKLSAREVAALQRFCAGLNVECAYLCGAGGVTDAAREQANLTPKVHCVSRARMIALAGAAHPATDRQLVALGRRYRSIHSPRGLRSRAFDPQRAEKYLLYGLLLLGLYIFTGLAYYSVPGLVCLTLMTLCRISAAHRKKSPLE